MPSARPRRPVRWWQWSRWPEMLRFLGWIYLGPWGALTAIAGTTYVLWSLTR